MYFLWFLFISLPNGSCRNAGPADYKIQFSLLVDCLCMMFCIRFTIFILDLFLFLPVRGTKLRRHCGWLNCLQKSLTFHIVSSGFFLLYLMLKFHGMCVGWETPNVIIDQYWHVFSDSQLFNFAQTPPYFKGCTLKQLLNLWNIVYFSYLLWLYVFSWGIFLLHCSGIYVCSQS